MGRAPSMYMDAPAIPCLTIGPGRVSLWEMPAHWYTHGRPTNTGPRDATLIRTEDPVQAAKRSRRRALDAAGWLWLRSRGRWVTDAFGREVYFRQAFWTLTLPESAPEANARRALSRFWTWARNRAGVRSYLWTAELTDRGRVHFHAIVNQWCDIGTARAAWFRCLRAEGCIRERYAAPPNAMLKINRAHSSEQAKAYAAKYLSKAFGNDRVKELTKRLENAEALFGTPKQPADLDAIIFEIRARLADAEKTPEANVKRWAASQDCSRDAVTVNSAEEDAETMRRLKVELTTAGVRWCPPGEHGTAGFFDLGRIDRHRTPLLSSLLKTAAHDASETVGKGTRKAAL